jgi:hypothetical protein
MVAFRRFGGILTAASVTMAGFLALVPACGGGGNSTGGASSGGSVVGAGGGTIASAGVTLTVPPGALNDNVTITLAQSTDAVPSGYFGLSPVFVFGPDGLVFAKAVTVEVPFTDDGAGPSTLFWSLQGGTAFQNVGGSAAAGILTAQVTHFSRGFVGRAHATGSDASVSDSSSPDSNTFDALAVDSPAASTQDGSGVTGPADDASSSVDAPSGGGPSDAGSVAETSSDASSSVDAPSGGGPSDAGSVAESGSDSGPGCICSAGQTCCLGVCVATSSNQANCGHCGVSCGTGTCTGGLCSTCAVYGQSCISEACCTGTVCLNGTCTFPAAT